MVINDFDFAENIIYAETVSSIDARVDLVEMENNSCEGGKRRSKGRELRNSNSSSVKGKLKR